MRKEGLVITSIAALSIIALCIVDNKNNAFIDENFKSDNQSDFVKYVRSYSEQYKKEYSSNNEQAAKEMQPERDHYLASKFNRQGYYIKEWSGVVHDIQKKEDGSITFCLNINDDHQKILLCNATSKIMLKNTFNSPFYEKYMRNEITNNDAALFKAASGLNIGDSILFSGNFFQTYYQSDNAELEEVSFTSDGSITEPEYMFKFTQIMALKNHHNT
ncbi:hypothetical protein [Enterobacter bugandensis]|uniref:hypothetical protein n=1 Tax=Enterobacter bugandensis TaxID=881260 RepID=UPI0021D1050B|nr:hypothetical protein [Enterobacter bugandensis]MCU6214427.1 hypothetical protein [Enterobacter bugandensis]